MTPKEKAIELIDKYYNYVNCWGDDGNVDYDKAYENTKQCALIAVQNIICANPHSNPLNTNQYSTISYWQEVKSEIEKL